MVRVCVMKVDSQLSHFFFFLGGYGLLQVAVKVQDADIVREILKSGECDINFADHRGVTYAMNFFFFFFFPADFCQCIDASFGSHFR